MGAVVQLAASRVVTEDEVARAWAAFRALKLAERNDLSLADDPAHQAAVIEARDRFGKLFDEWAGS